MLTQNRVGHRSDGVKRNAFQSLQDENKKLRYDTQRIFHLALKSRWKEQIYCDVATQGNSIIIIQERLP